MNNYKSFFYSNINSLATTQVKSGAGYLHTITINKSGASSNTISVYDATSGTTSPIAVIDGTATAGNTLLFDINFINGLRIITATGTAADITVSWE